MFAQLMLTLLVVLAITEALTRLVFGRSSLSILARPLGEAEEPATPADPEDVTLAADRQLLEERRHEVEEAQRRLDLARQTTAVTERLNELESELREARRRLQAVERRGDRSWETL